MFLIDMVLKHIMKAEDLFEKCKNLDCLIKVILGLGKYVKYCNISNNENILNNGILISEIQIITDIFTVQCALTQRQRK